MYFLSDSNTSFINNDIIIVSSFIKIVVFCRWGFIRWDILSVELLSSGPFVRAPLFGRACVRACVRACMRACVRMCGQMRK